MCAPDGSGSCMQDVAPGVAVSNERRSGLMSSQSASRRTGAAAAGRGAEVRREERVGQLPGDDRLRDDLPLLPYGLRDGRRGRLGRRLGRSHPRLGAQLGDLVLRAGHERRVVGEQLQQRGVAGRRTCQALRHAFDAPHLGVPGTLGGDLLRLGAQLSDQQGDRLEGRQGGRCDLPALDVVDHPSNGVGQHLDRLLVLAWPRRAGALGRARPLGRRKPSAARAATACPRWHSHTPCVDRFGPPRSYAPRPHLAAEPALGAAGVRGRRRSPGNPECRRRMQQRATSCGPGTPFATG